LKPVFVRKKDRLTVQEREREEAKQRQAEREAQILAEQRYSFYLFSLSIF
jgi:microfibrillar-associated protein 1